MRRAGHHILVVGADLRALENLERAAAVGVDGDIWASAGLPLVANHSADTQRAVELRAHEAHEVGAFQRVEALVVGRETVAHEFYGLGCDILSGVDSGNEAGDSVVEKHHIAADNLFVSHRCVAVAVGNDVVDILDEDDCGINVVQILDKSAMAAGTEEKAVVLKERLVVVDIGGDSVGRRLLLAERHREPAARARLGSRNSLGELFFEETAVVGRHGEMELDLAGGVGRRLGTLGQLFVERSA